MSQSLACMYFDKQHFGTCTELNALRREPQSSESSAGNSSTSHPKGIPPKLCSESAFALRLNGVRTLYRKGLHRGIAVLHGLTASSMGIVKGKSLTRVIGVLG